MPSACSPARVTALPSCTDDSRSRCLKHLTRHCTGGFPAGLRRRARPSSLSATVQYRASRDVSSGAVLQEAVLHQVPQVATEPAPGESLAPRRTHRCGEQGLCQAAVVATLAALGLRGQSRMDAESRKRYNDNVGLFYRMHPCTITAVLGKTIVLSHALLCHRLRTSRDKDLGAGICVQSSRSLSRLEFNYVGIATARIPASINPLLACNQTHVPLRPLPFVHPVEWSSLLSFGSRASILLPLS